MRVLLSCLAFGFGCYMATAIVQAEDTDDHDGGSPPPACTTVVQTQDHDTVTVNVPPCAPCPPAPACTLVPPKIIRARRPHLDKRWGGPVQWQLVMVP